MFICIIILSQGSYSLNKFKRQSVSNKTNWRWIYSKVFKKKKKKKVFSTKCCLVIKYFLYDMLSTDLHHSYPKLLECHKVFQVSLRKNSYVFDRREDYVGNLTLFNCDPLGLGPFFHYDHDEEFGRIPMISIFHPTDLCQNV